MEEKCKQDREKWKEQEEENNLGGGEVDHLHVHLLMPLDWLRIQDHPRLFLLSSLPPFLCQKHTPSLFV